MAQQHRQMKGTMLSRGMIGGLLLVVLLGGSVWVANQVFSWRQPMQRHTSEPQRAASLVEYVVSVEPDRLRISGTANVPNGVILVGTLDKVGLGPLEIKEALVMNRIFAMEFGPEWPGQYSWLGQIEPLPAGLYRVSIEFDPAQQSPFVRDSLWRGDVYLPSATDPETGRELDPTRFRLAKTFAVGTREEQQAAQAREQQYRQTIHQHLDETLGALTTQWQHLRTQYLQDRTQGGFSRSDPRANVWQEWTARWLKELRMLGEKYRLRETTSWAVPYHSLHEALLTIYRQMPVISDLYFEVLLQERSPTDQELQRLEQQMQAAFGDALVQLGRSDSPQLTVEPDSSKHTVIVTSPVINVRSGPGMNHEVFSQMKKDDVVDLLGEQGEWFQVKLPTGQVGWVHHNVARKSAEAQGLTDEPKRSDGTSVFGEGRAPLAIEPVVLQAMPIDHLPRPTPDEFKIYAEVEQQLRDLPTGGTGEHQTAQQRILQRLSEKYSVSPGLLWNVYLKVQGWEVRQ